MKKFIIAIFIFGVTSAYSAGLAAPTEFRATEVTDTSISFTWSNNASIETQYRVCEKIKISPYYINCSHDLGENAKSYDLDSLEEYTSKNYVSVVSDGSNVSPSNEITVKTTHTWSGELLMCVNEDLGYGIKNTTHTPTKAELESLDFTFSCANREAAGTINSITDLVNIVSINISDNNFSGQIPSQIGTLTSLRSMIFYNNELNGSLPIEIGLLTNLETLYLNYNELSGSLPQEIGGLSSIKILSLYGNNFDGELPSSIWSLTSLNSLYLSANNFRGVLPTQLGNLTELTGLLLNANEFSGSIPSEMASLIKLVDLSISDNNFSGKIPVEIGLLTTLEHLGLSNNNLSGSIPENIGNLINLEHLYLHENKLSGEVPASIVNLNNIVGERLGVHTNCNLYSSDEDVQAYIDLHARDGGENGYLHMLNTNTKDCFSSSPAVIMYLLN